MVACSCFCRWNYSNLDRFIFKTNSSTKIFFTIRQHTKYLHIIIRSHARNRSPSTSCGTNNSQEHFLLGRASLVETLAYKFKTNEYINQFVNRSYGQSINSAISPSMKETKSFWGIEKWMMDSWTEILPLTHPLIPTHQKPQTPPAPTHPPIHPCCTY